MPDAIGAVHRLGVAVPAAEACPLRGVRFLSAGLSAETEFPSDGSGLSIRRTTLHRIMTERAAALGADLLWQNTVTQISDEDVLLGKRLIPVESAFFDMLDYNGLAGTRKSSL